MSRVAGIPRLQTLTIDRRSGQQIHIQLSAQLRALIMNGYLVAGTKLPSSTELAKTVGCARNTIVQVYEQLIAEGFLEGVHRVGTFVGSEFDMVLLKKHMTERDDTCSERAPYLSSYASRLSQTYHALGPSGTAFALAGPDFSQFPFDIWSRISGRIWRRPRPELVVDRDSQGYIGLRKAIANYLTTIRGLTCRSDQVVITAGSTQAIDFVLRLLLEPNDQIWVEEPGYPELIDKIRALMFEPVPVEVDEQGIKVAVGQDKAPRARMAFVTPSHQFPTGAVLSLQRRLELLEWARETDAWIIEDDYDSEFRYEGKPIPPLQSLDRDGLVVYMGTFSKVLFDGLRIGFLVLPDRLIDAFVRARRHLDLWPSIIVQPVLARFIDEGHFLAHLQRMRNTYAARRNVLVDEANSRLSGLLDLGRDTTGIHVAARFTSELSGVSDTVAATWAHNLGVQALPISRCCVLKQRQSALVLGYATVNEPSIKEGIQRLAVALERARKDRTREYSART